MGDKIVDGWPIYLVVIVITTLTSILVESAFGKVSESASIEYVDKGVAKLELKDSEIELCLDKKVDKITLDNYINSQQKINSEISATLKTLDSRIYDIWIKRNNKQNTP